MHNSKTIKAASKQPSQKPNQATNLIIVAIKTPKLTKQEKTS